MQSRATIIGKVLKIAAPILFSSLVNLFIPLINAAIIGQNNAAYLYVLGIYLPIGFLQTALNESMRVSAIVLSSQAAGSNDKALWGRQLLCLLRLTFCIFLSLAFLFWLTHSLFMALFVVPPVWQTIVYNFVELFLLVGAVLSVSILMTASLYGIGQVYAVTVVSFLVFCVGIPLTFVLVYVAHWGLYALPASTIVTASGSGIWAALRLRRLGVLPPLNLGWLLDYWNHLQEISQISLPIFGGYVILFSNSVLFNRLLAIFPPSAIAGFGVAYRIQSIILMPAIALGIGLAINVNRLVAAEQREQVHAFFSTALSFSGVLFVVIGLAVFFGRSLLPRLVTSDETVIAAASQYLGYMGLAYMIIGPLETLFTFFEETGNGVRSLTVNTFILAVQIVLAFYIAWAYHSLALVYQVTALSYLVTILYISYELMRSKRLRGKQIRVIRAR